MGRQKKKNGEGQRYSWEGRRRRMVKPRDIGGKAEEEEDIGGKAEEEEW